MTLAPRDVLSQRGILNPTRDIRSDVGHSEEGGVPRGDLREQESHRFHFEEGHQGHPKEESKGNVAQGLQETLNTSAVHTFH